MAVHVHHGMLSWPDVTPDSGVSEQIGAPMTDHTGTVYHPVRGTDGAEYVAEGSGGAWRIVRSGSYGLGAVTRGHTLESAVQHLNTFHVGETCAQCGHVNSERGHACDACGRIRYVSATGEYVPAGERS